MLLPKLSLNHVLNQFAHWIWGQLIHFITQVMDQWVFAPLAWSTGATQLYDMSRNLAMTLVGAVLVWGVIKSMWPQLSPSPGLSPTMLLHRGITAGFLVGSAVYGVRVLLTINNALVLSLGGSKLGHVQWVGPALTLSPLLAVVTAGIMVALLIYLAIFYALRVVEIFLLTALIPMFAVLWIQSADGTWLRNIGRELIVAVFIQSVHAGAFWLFIRFVGTGGASVATLFEAMGVLWYMAKLPEQMRRLMGLSGKGGMWQW